MKTSRKIIIGVVVMILMVFGSFLGKAIFDYVEFKEVEAAASGFPVECGIIETTDVIPGCTRSAGKCTCPLCDAFCEGSTEIDFIAQDSPKCAIKNFCVSPEFANYTGRPPKPGDQAIVGATSNIITANAVYGTPGLAVSGIDRIISWLDKLYIAGLR